MMIENKNRLPETGRQFPFRIARLFSRGVAVSAEKAFLTQPGCRARFAPEPAARAAHDS
jgi:hypothetical protein